MSRNNLILVIKKEHRWYVVPDVNADTQWNEEFASQHINLPTSRFTKSRAKALLRAHDIQRRMETEYGVREMYINDA
jgi:hypothetical protein|tara:strand:- start:12679 stop:12909 length:231 start_codon:yes stop_codon:yes gene_type:complete